MKAYQQLEKLFEKMSHLQHLHAIASWDEAVIMPVGGGDSRAHALSTLKAMQHELLIDPRVGDWIDTAKSQLPEGQWQQANLRWMEKHYRNATCLPVDLVKNTTAASIRCEQAWRHLRADNDWKSFAPLLETVLGYVKEGAALRAEVFNKTTYDILLDDFSPGLSQQIIDPIFDELKVFLPGIIPEIIERQKSQPIIEITGEFSPEKQKYLGEKLMRAIGFDFNHGRLDVSHHPFCGGVARDVRITTRYKDDEFISAVMAICHETGHAMYELGLPDKWLDQPVGQALGMSLHESQSLLIEMQACRSSQFMQFMAPLAQAEFGESKALSAENLHRHYMKVQPGLIRVDADEVTYPLHVILRYEIEKKLIGGEVSVKDLPELWHSQMQTLLGISTENDYKNGVMQDVHWPSGAFGYFPAYTLGALIAAQLFNTATQQQPQILADISQGDFSSLFAWLRPHVHNKASLLPYDELLREASGDTLQASYYIEHIRRRYLG